MSKHTKGPWRITTDFSHEYIPSKHVEIVAANDTVVGCMVFDSLNDEHHANIRRVVACVNACEGINPEAVPGMLEALETIVEAYYAGIPGMLDASATVATIERAIAKAREGAE